MFAKLRLSQIRILATLLEFCGRTSVGKSAILRVRANRPASAAFNFLVGYRRTFPTFAEAEKYAAGFLHLGHEHPDNIAHHTWQATRLRESDYPLLFYLSPIADGLRRVFDLGGNVGNLFYTLQQELTFPETLQWEVYDLPMMREAGKELARSKNERRIRFTDDLSGASGCDLFIASGCLHYFERPLAETLSSLIAPPTHLIINRTPCTRDNGPAGEDLITAQDNDTYIVACKMHSPTKLVGSLRVLGYSLRARWRVYERHLWIPLYPDLSCEYYSGFYFVKDLPPSGTEQSLRAS